MKRTRVWLMGMAVMLGWVNLTASQDRPKPSRLPQGVKVLRDLQYVEDGHERNRLDLYLPEEAQGPLPVIVWIHGGGLAGRQQGELPRRDAGRQRVRGG